MDQRSCAAETRDRIASFLMAGSSLSGRRLAGYDVGPLVGAGGMGEVYRARDSKLNRDVAIKILLAAVASDAERLARFRREAQVLGALNHQNIAHIHGIEEGDAGPFLVMEFVEGPTLADRIAQGPIPVDEALAIARQIADALESAHERGIIHRDLKPANIKVSDDGAVKVLDFGLAKALDPVDIVAVVGGPADDHHACDDGRRSDPRNRGLHESRTSERPRRRSTLGCVGVWLRALRDAHWTSCF